MSPSRGGGLGDSPQLANGALVDPEPEIVQAAAAKAGGGGGSAVVEGGKQRLAWGMGAVSVGFVASADAEVSAFTRILPEGEGEGTHDS